MLEVASRNVGGRPLAKDKLKKPVCVRLTDREYEQLYAYSRLHDLDVTRVIRDAIRRCLLAVR